MNNIDYIIMCDDDVSAFGEAIDSRNKREKTFTPILKPLESFIKSGYAVGGINYRQYSWSSTKKISINTQLIEVCVFINIKSINHNYEDYFNMKEDRQFIIECVKRTNGVIKFNNYFYECPQTGTNNGGLIEDYKMNKNMVAAKRLASSYPKYIKIVEKLNGQFDAKINIKKIASDYKRIIL